MRQTLTAVGCAAAAGLLAGLLLGWRLWHRAPPSPTYVRHLDTVLVHAKAVHDTVRVMITVARTDSARADTAATVAAATTAAILDTLVRENGDSACAERVRTVEAKWMDAYRGAAVATGDALLAAMRAEGTLGQVRAELATARDSLRASQPWSPRWGLGPAWTQSRLLPTGVTAGRRVGNLTLLGSVTRDVTWNQQGRRVEETRATLSAVYWW